MAPKSTVIKELWEVISEFQMEPGQNKHKTWSKTHGGTQNQHSHFLLECNWDQAGGAGQKNQTWSINLSRPCQILKNMHFLWKKTQNVYFWDSTCSEIIGKQKEVLIYGFSRWNHRKTAYLLWIQRKVTETFRNDHFWEPLGLVFRWWWPNQVR